jgi:hypothetical protein
LDAVEERIMAEDADKPSWVAKTGLAIAILSFALSIFGVYQWWNSEVNSKINAAIDLSTKDIQDSGIEKIRNDYIDWFNGKVTESDRDRKTFAAQTYVLYLDYVAQLINSKRVHEGYISLLLKCELINNYSNLYKNKKPHNDLPTPDKIVNLVKYDQEHQGMNCRLVSRS